MHICLHTFAFTPFFIFTLSILQPSVISLSKLLVREKGDTWDSCGMYLICQSDKSEMYELGCKNAEERKAWVKTINEAINNCPLDGE